MDNNRFDEAKGLDYSTTRRDINELLDLPLNTSVRKLREMFGITYKKKWGLYNTERKSTPCKLVSLDLIKTVNFTSVIGLTKYLNSGISYNTIGIILQHGCIIQIDGSPWYIVKGILSIFVKKC